MEVTCKKCGAALGASNKFCMKCGTPVPVQTEEPAVTTPVEEKPVGIEAPEPEVYVTAEMPKEPVKAETLEQNVTVGAERFPEAAEEKRAKGKKCSGSATALAVLLCFFGFLFGLAANGLFLTRNFADAILEDGIANKIDLTEIDSALFEEAVINGVQLEGDSVAEMISGYLLEEGVHVTAKEVEDLMQADFVNEFLNRKSSDYYDDFLHQSGKGVIAEKEVAELLRENLDEIQSTLDIIIDEKDIDRVQTYLEENIELSEVSSLSNVMDEVDFPLNLVSMFVSYPVILALLAVCLLLFLVVFFIKGRPLRGMRPVGITVALLGAVNIGLFILAGRLPEILNDVAAFGEKIYRNLFQPFKNMSLVLGGVLLGVGIIFAVVGSIISAAANRKYSNQ